MATNSASAPRAPLASMTGFARLAATAASCQERGAVVTECIADVRDAPAIARWVEAAGQLDLVVANAGVSSGTGGVTEPPDAARTVFETNVNGVVNTVLPALGRMVAQDPAPDGVRGRIVVISSLAAFVAVPGAPAYCASKASVQRWAEALDATERRRGVRLTAICPGYIRTPMTDCNPFPMPFLMDVAPAAERTLRAVARGQVRHAFPLPMYLGARLVGGLPPTWRAALLAGLPSKIADPAR